MSSSSPQSVEPPPSDQPTAQPARELALSEQPDAKEAVKPDNEPTSEVPAGSLETLPTSHHGRLWAILWGTPKRRVGTIGSIAILIALIIGITPLKYSLLGTFISSQLEVRVADTENDQLLPGAVVTVGATSATTDKTGFARLTGLHPGKTTLSVTKPAYKLVSQEITVGFGDAGTQDIKLSATGIRLSFNLTDYVTGKPLADTRVQLAGADVVSDASGHVTASVAPDQQGTHDATLTKTGFNDLIVKVNVAIGSPTTSLKLVPSGKVYYLSNRSGHVDLYGANLDGSGAAVVLAGTGNEDDATGILPNVYDPSVLALVSSRAGKRVSGALQEDLYVFHPATAQLTLVDSSINFSNYRTWLGKTLIYQKYGVQTAQNINASIHTYDPVSGKNTTIVSCTEDNACPQALYSTDDSFYYTLFGAPVSATAKGLFVVKSGTTTPVQLSDMPRTQALRQSKSALILGYYNYNQPYPNDTWASLDLAAGKLTALANGPTSQNSRTFVDSPGDKYSASVDNRDGQTDLYLTNEDGSNEQKLTTTGDVTQFVQWYGDDYIVYSAKNTLYVVGVAGGTPQKIANFYSGRINPYSGGYNPTY